MNATMKSGDRGQQIADSRRRKPLGMLVAVSLTIRSIPLALNKKGK
jgi:hypothetical protein